MKVTETKATESEIGARKKLFELFDQAYHDDSIRKVDLFQNLGLFLRCSALTKLLFLNELYQHILDKPGIIVELGVHLGQNIVTFENLRAVHEPWNQNRRVVGFDTFTSDGYASRSSIDGTSAEITGSGYKLKETYVDFLTDLTNYHEKDHILSHIKKVSLEVGDVMKTVPAFFEKNQGDVVALAYFDLATYHPTKTALNAILPHLLPGSVLLMDELNFKDYPGASIAFKEFVHENKLDIEIKMSTYMKDRAIVIYKGRK
jgi:hypothetical protein